MKKLRVMTILGTRPEIIRLSRVIARLDRFTDHTIVHTGQNWAYELNELFFSDLSIRKPDFFLGAGGGSLGETLGKILSQTERVLLEVAPDAVLILGDTNSSLAAIMARRLKIPVYHMEAGNRSFDRNVPEETNRKIVDHISDFNLVYTEHARRHLIAEGVPHRRIYLTGSPMGEVLEHYREQFERADCLARLGLEAKGYFIVSLHREENVDHSGRLADVVSSLNVLASHYDMPVVVSTHPRTRKRLDALLSPSPDPRIRWMEPFGFHDYIGLQLQAFCTISDSGTITEESAILGFPAVTPRSAIERPEGLDQGSILMTGLGPDEILNSVAAATELCETHTHKTEEAALPQEYRIQNTSQRVVSLILSTARVSNSWDGISKNDLS